MENAGQILYDSTEEMATACSYEISRKDLKDRVRDICERSGNLMINLFDIGERTFLCCSPSFETMLGYASAKIIKGGWNFWFDKIDAREKTGIKNRISEFLFGFKAVNTAIYMKYHLRSSSGNWYYVDHTIEKYILCGRVVAFSYICDYTGKESIAHCLTPENRKSNSGVSQNINISPREWEVLKLISNGFSSKQIADKLYISYHTAVSHRKHLIEKFKVQNTAQLIKRATELIRL